MVELVSSADAMSSLWQSTPVEAPATGSVAAGETVDLAIVGGGLLGLSTAFHAARSGLSVRVLEAETVGAGASGLNGGQVIPGLKHDPEELIEIFGHERGEALVAFAASTADAVFDLIRDEGLAVPSVRTGWIQAAHTRAAAEAAATRARRWQQRGADVAVLDRAAIAQLTGVRGYLGGWIDRRAGVIHPLAFTRELARVATAAGVKIASGAKVEALTRKRAEWRVRTADGAELTASKVVVATDAYSDNLLGGLARTIVPLHSFQIATEPLALREAASILPGGQAVSDSRRILIYYRMSPDGRLILGGRGSMGVPRSTAAWVHLERAMLRLFPALAGVGIAHRWFGRVGVTLDHLPHLHEPQPGLIAAIGCQGRGIGLMTALGQRLANYALTGDRQVLPLPLTPVRPIPFHRFRNVAVGATIAWYLLLDAFEQ